MLCPNLWLYTKWLLFDILKRLVEKELIEQQECIINGVKFCRYKANVPNFIGSEESALGGSEESALLNSSYTVKELKEGIKESIAKDADTFADEMYNLYPTKCPKRNKYLGKSHKDKAKIKALLKLYSMEEIEKVLRYEVETKFGISYMKDFGTFLNNFPDPSQIEFTPTDNDTGTDKTFFNGVEYR